MGRTTAFVLAMLGPGSTVAAADGGYTVLSPLQLRPLAHGADFVLHNATKIRARHPDASLGVIACVHADDATRLAPRRGASGIIAAPGRRLVAAAGPHDPRAARRAPIRRRPGTRPPPLRARGQRHRQRDHPRRRRLHPQSPRPLERDRVPPGLLRLSVGLEDTEDL